MPDIGFDKVLGIGGKEKLRKIIEPRKNAKSWKVRSNRNIYEIVEKVTDAIRDVLSIEIQKPKSTVAYEIKSQSRRVGTCIFCIG